MKQHVEPDQLREALIDFLQKDYLIIEGWSFEIPSHVFISDEKELPQQLKNAEFEIKVTGTTK